MILQIRQILPAQTLLMPKIRTPSDAENTVTSDDSTDGTENTDDTDGDNTGDYDNTGDTDDGGDDSQYQIDY